MKMRTLIAAAMTAVLIAGPALAIEASTDAMAATSTSKSMVLSAKAKNGLVKKGSNYYFYKNGKMVKKAWKTVKGARYYFQKNGKAAIGSVKINGKYYVFSATGKLAKGKKTRVVTIKKVKYQVTKAGRAKSGWGTGKTTAFKANGAMMLNGTLKIGSKTYCFNAKGKLIKGDGVKKISTIDSAFLCASSSGVYNATRTKQLNQYAVYNRECTALIGLLGTPSSVKVNVGCNYINGELASDVIYTYPNFTLSTFRLSNGKEYFSYLAAR